MKRLFAKLGFKNVLQLKETGVMAINDLEDSFVVSWDSITKVIFSSYFEEYSGYFLSEDYRSKMLYHSIFIDCNQNMVKIRTGGTPTVKKNTTDAFTTKYGTTCINNAVFIEYKDSEKLKLYGIHFENSSLKKNLKILKENLPEGIEVIKKTRIDGFNHIHSL